MNWVILQSFLGEETGTWDGSWKDELNGLPVTGMFLLEELMRWWPHPLEMCSYMTVLECWDSVHSLVEVDEPYGQLFRGCLVPVDGVAFPQSYNWLILLVMSAFAQSPFQVQWVIVVVVFYYFHFQVGWLVGLDVYLDGKKKQPNKKKITKSLMNYSERFRYSIDESWSKSCVCTGQEPVGCALMFNFLGFHFNKANCFQGKKRAHFLIHWVQVHVPEAAAGLRYSTALCNPQQQDSIYLRHLTCAEQGSFCLDFRSLKPSSVVRNWL